MLQSARLRYCRAVNHSSWISVREEELKPGSPVPSLGLAAGCGHGPEHSGPSGTGTATREPKATLHTGQPAGPRDRH